MWIWQFFSNFLCIKKKKILKIETCKFSIICFAESYWLDALMIISSSRETEDIHLEKFSKIFHAQKGRKKFSKTKFVGFRWKIFFAESYELGDAEFIISAWKGTKDMRLEKFSKIFQAHGKEEKIFQDEIYKFSMKKLFCWLVRTWWRRIDNISLKRNPRPTSRNCFRNFPRTWRGWKNFPRWNL